MTAPATAAMPGLILPGDWVADPALCTLTFAVRNFGLRTVTGRIPLTSASVTVSANGLPTSVRAELDAHGIDTANRRRDKDLCGRRFLATSQWPAITFQADSIQHIHSGWTIGGTLTVKDTHCPVRLDVASPSTPPGEPPTALDLHATGYLDRRAAGITTAPALLIGHMIRLSLAVRLRSPAASPAQAQQRSAAGNEPT